MGYVLGSETEAMNVTDQGIEYVPAGGTHAVDLASPCNSATAVLAYAVCGAAVRAWPDVAFDAQAGNVHDECITAVENVSPPGARLQS
jgi:hypothetical protein